MINYQILVIYLAKLFTKQFFIASGAIICVLFIANAFDVLQKFKSTDISAGDFWQLISLKIPYLFNEVSVLVCFIATFMFLRNITRENELIIILSSGVPIWQIFIVPIIVTFFIGLIMLSIVNPFGTHGLQEYEKLEAKVNKTPHLNFVISQSGIFFFEKFAGNNRLIQAKSINADKQMLSDVTILIVDSHNNLTTRIDTVTAILEHGAFKLHSPTITYSKSSENLELLNLPTNLSIDNLMQRFSSPEIIPIWQLNSSIEQFASSGLTVIKYRLYYYKQLLKPIAMVAMSLTACWFISFNIRDNSRMHIAVLGLFAGMSTYFFLEIALRILAYSGLHPAFATLLPILFIILISNFVILHFQEA